MSTPQTAGTTITVRYHYTVDGDTIRVYLPSSPTSESIRIMCLDTEESFSFGGKPKTPWGTAAKLFARQFFADATTLTLEFPGPEPAQLAARKYRGNFGRLLCFVHHNGVDFQQLMIRNGYSPYFNKYGNAPFPAHHARYVRAERLAQSHNLGVWDQLSVNGFVARNYPVLKAWWDLRASRIDHYRSLSQSDHTIYNTRHDYHLLAEHARANTLVTIFTELSNLRRTADAVAIVDVGSDTHPFALKIPDVRSPNGRRIAALLRNRYIGSANRPALGYCFATGRLEMFRGTPHMEILNAAAITDTLGPRAEVSGALPPPPPGVDADDDADADADDDDEAMTPTPEEAENGENGDQPVGRGADLAIVACLPDPQGTDRGNETVTLRNRGSTEAALEGWALKDRVGAREMLRGTVLAGGELVVRLSGGGVRLNNMGDDILLYDPKGILVSMVAYRATDVKPAQSIEF